ncbi:MAG: hypothetical protein QXK74_03525 [Candidatus Nitrosocaldaceae archaeon]
MTTAQIEIVIRLPVTNQTYKEFAETIARALGQSKVEVQKSSKSLSSEEKTQLNAKLKELQTLLEIAKARGQTSVVAETEAEIKKLEKELS